MTTRIPTTPEVARFNRAVLRADQLSGWRFDRVEAEHLTYWLRSAGWVMEADELEQAQNDLPRNNAGLITRKET